MSIKRVFLLTGEKNNAGDFMIARQTKVLFGHFLPSVSVKCAKRHFIETEDIMNMKNADLIVISGGPAVSNTCAENMHMTRILAEVQTPMVMFGVGCFNHEVSYENFSFCPSPLTKRLFERLETTAIPSTTRDFKTLYYLRNAGYKNFIFTGCPVCYDLDYMENAWERFDASSVNRIIFSVGAPFQQSWDSYKQQLAVLKALKYFFSGKEIIVACHHSIDKNVLENNYQNKDFTYYLKFIEILQKREKVKIANISGSYEKMYDLYTSCDLHIGYRVHGHILMTALRKPSLLICEDGRGVAMSEVIQGPHFNAYKYQRKTSLFGEKSTILKRYDLHVAENILCQLQQANKKHLILNYLPENHFISMQQWFKGLAST